MLSTPYARTHRLETLLALLSANGDGGGGLKTPYSTPSLFVDPANSTGLASDLNSGLDATHPIRTTTRLNQLLANKFVNFTNGLAFVGSPVTLRTGSMTAVQAITPATNTRERVTDAAVASWTGDIGNFIVDTTGGNSGTSAPIMHDVGGGSHQADLGRPVTTIGAAGLFTPLDAYAVKRGSDLTLGAISPGFVIGGAIPGAATITYMSDDSSGAALDLSTVALSGLTFQDFTFLSTGPTLGSSIIDQVGTTFTRCIFVDNAGTFVSLNLNAIIQLNNCILLSGAGTQLGAFNMSAGGTFGVIAGIFLGVSGDTYFERANLNINTLTLLAAQVLPGIGNGVQIQNVPFLVSAVQIFIDADLSTGLLWGNGNTGPGMTIFPGATAKVSAATPPIVTGTSDFRFFGQSPLGFVATGRPWNEAGGVYGAAAALTWANFAGAPFNFQCHDVATNASIVGV